MTAELSAESRGTSLSALRFLPSPIREARRPALAIPVAWATTFFPSIVLAALVAALLPAVAQPQFDVSGGLALFAIVIFAPVLETLIMGTALLVLLRIVSPVTAIVLSAAGWGVAHSLAAPAWGLVIWWPFLVLSTLFVVWRERSVLAAFAISALVHALHNLPTALLIASGKAS